MFHYCLLLVLLLVLLLKQPTGARIVEGIDDAQGGEHTSLSVREMVSDELQEELQRIRDENYADAAGFEALLQKGVCTDEPHSPTNHSCKIDDSKKNKPILDLRYINPGPLELDPSNEYTYQGLCVDTFKQTIDTLVSDNMKPDPELYKRTFDPSLVDPKTFFTNKFSRGQYPGYTHNNYLDRTRYVASDEPLPVNPDFFVDGGGTYA
jgi:hypothetical protein